MELRTQIVPQSPPMCEKRTLVVAKFLTVWGKTPIMPLILAANNGVN